MWLRGRVVAPCACRRGLQLLCLTLFFPGVLQAGAVLDSNVSRDGNSYSLSITARVEATPAQVYRSITDFSNLPAINPSIEEGSVLENEGNRRRVRSVIKVCILVFCKRVERVQDVFLIDAHTVVAVIVPGAGDFRAGKARWSISTDDGATRLLFSETFEPDFWVPPVIGPWLIERKLVREVAETAMYIEGMNNGQ